MELYSDVYQSFSCIIFAKVLASGSHVKCKDGYKNRNGGYMCTVKFMHGNAHTVAMV